MTAWNSLYGAKREQISDCAFAAASIMRYSALSNTRVIGVRSSRSSSDCVKVEIYSFMIAIFP